MKMSHNTFFFFLNFCFYTPFFSLFFYCFHFFISFVFFALFSSTTLNLNNLNSIFPPRFLASILLSFNFITYNRVMMIFTLLVVYVLYIFHLWNVTNLGLSLFNVHLWVMVPLRRVFCVMMLLPSVFVSLGMWFSLIIKISFHLFLLMLMVLLLFLLFLRFLMLHNGLNQAMYILGALLSRPFPTLNRHLNVHQ